MNLEIGVIHITIQNAHFSDIFHIIKISQNSKDHKNTIFIISMFSFILWRLNNYLFIHSLIFFIHDLRLSSK